MCIVEGQREYRCCRRGRAAATCSSVRPAMLRPCVGERDAAAAVISSGRAASRIAVNLKVFVIMCSEKGRLP